MWLIVGLDFRGPTNRARPPRSAERRLYDRLFEDYDPGCRPVLNASNTVTVSLSISLSQIMDLVN